MRASTILKFSRPYNKINTFAAQACSVKMVAYIGLVLIFCFYRPPAWSIMHTYGK